LDRHDMTAIMFYFTSAETGTSGQLSSITIPDQ
jgi:hypothetical protein